jgi:hypothetical protein
MNYKGKAAIFLILLVVSLCQAQAELFKGSYLPSSETEKSKIDAVSAQLAKSPIVKSFQIVQINDTAFSTLDNGFMLNISQNFSVEIQKGAGKEGTPFGFKWHGKTKDSKEDNFSFLIAERNVIGELIYQQRNYRFWRINVGANKYLSDDIYVIAEVKPLPAAEM